jgi:electron transport complex protein RnfB
MHVATPGNTGWSAWSQADADAARARHDARALRLQREKQENDARLAAKAIAKLAEVDASTAQTDAERAEKERKRAIIQAAIERARQQKEAAAPPGKKS